MVTFAFILIFLTVMTMGVLPLYAMHIKDEDDMTQ